MNGHLRSPKIHKFNTLICLLNNRNNVVISIKDKDTSDLYLNAWLAGFIDADASFDISIRSSGRIEARFRVEQRLLDPITNEPYLPLFELIARTFDVRLNTSIHNNNKYHSISVTKPTTLVKLCDYLNTYPLYTVKYLNFKDFETCVRMMLAKEHLTEPGKAKIKSIQQNMNSRRTLFTFNHIRSEFLK